MFVIKIRIQLWSKSLLQSTELFEFIKLTNHCLAETTYSCKLSDTTNLSVVVFSSPEHKVLRVSYCDRPLSVVRRRASCVVRKLFYLNIFSSETTHWILTKLHRNDPWVVPYQSCSNGSDWLHK